MKKYILSALLLLSGITTESRDVTIKFKKTKDEAYTSENLRAYLQKNPKPAILLRTPTAGGQISKGEGNDMRYHPEFYAQIEKVFLLSGFTVRDRSIYEKIVSQNQNIDYSKMSELTNTDIVLEVVNVSYQEYKTNEVLKKGESKTYNCIFRGFWGWKVDCRIILVTKNEVAGMYTFYKTPCTEGCDFSLGHSCNLVSPKVKTRDTENKPIPWAYKVDIDADFESFATTIANKMIKEMTKTSANTQD